MHLNITEYVFMIVGIIGWIVYGTIVIFKQKDIKIYGIISWFILPGLISIMLMWAGAGLLNTYYKDHEDKTEWVYECYWNITTLPDHSSYYVNKFQTKDGTYYEYYIPGKFGKERQSLASNAYEYSTSVRDDSKDNYRLERWQRKTKWKWFRENFNMSCQTMYVFNVPKGGTIETGYRN